MQKLPDSFEDETRELILRRQILESAGIFECDTCDGTGKVTGGIIRNYTTRAEYEEIVTRPCMNCDGTGTTLESHVRRALTKLAASINNPTLEESLGNYREIIGWDARGNV